MSKENINRIFEVFHSFSWFSEVGKPLGIESEFTKRIETCLSWDQAVEEANKETWLDLKNDAVGNLSSSLDQNYRREFQSWNQVSNDLSPLTDELMNNKILPNVPIKHRSFLFGYIRADIKRTLIEAHWSHLVKSEFFSPISYIYIKGHFPCGWRGDFPNGKLLVF